MTQTALSPGYDALRPAIARQIADGAIKPALLTLIDLSRRLPPDPAIWDDMASCDWALGDAATAIELADLTANHLGTDPPAWGKLGAMALSAGDQAGAQAAFETALRHKPREAKRWPRSTV
ncbi:hypothetical protein [Roseovarius aestuariivivens]|uniref:hypothetical protein n=1 Tax=Roseovarius aestuariivivens TaxID=1888910 RepID=UPI001080648E|nr:hypothetical protein [Roseovarius aestuariivivens]